MIGEMHSIVKELNNWEKRCAISTTVGSSVGVASGFAVIGGLVLLQPVAIVGLIVGAVAGLANAGTGLVKMVVFKKKITTVKKMLVTDGILFENLRNSSEELLNAIEQANRSFRSETEDTDVLNTTVGAYGIGLRCMASFLARLSCVKGAMHSLAGIGIILDSLVLTVNAKTLSEGAISKIGAQILDASTKLEEMREQVVRNCSNQNDREEEECSSNN
ncbi:unnamed protein product [Caenorhabditis sp. 36 PRJEB53466]|nr:unnamed protein product [Caenorhabditis sp. 36 PRJEB53466]